MMGKPADKHRKDTIWVPVTVALQPKVGGGYSKTMRGPAHVSANGDLDFGKLKMPVLVAFSLQAPAGVRFPSGPAGCIEIEKDAGNSSGQSGKDIFKYVAVSDDGLQLVLLDVNPRHSGKWKYTLFVEVDDSAPVAIDPMIINRFD